MDSLVGKVSEDGRTVLERMRRYNLNVILNGNGIAHNENTPKTELIKMVEAHGINPLQNPLPDGTPNPWLAVEVPTEGGATITQMYPNTPEHETANKELDYDTLREKNMHPDAKVPIADNSKELLEVNEKIDKLADIVGNLASAVNEITQSKKKKVKDRREGPMSSWAYSSLKQYAKEIGLTSNPSWKKFELLEAIEQHLQVNGENVT